MKLIPKPIRRWLIARAIRRDLRYLRHTATGLMRVEETAPVQPPLSPPPPRPAGLPPGRQRVRVGAAAIATDRGIELRPWTPPIPAEAHSGSWSDVHRFAPGAERQRDSRAACLGQEPPISLVCIGCELEQPPLFEERACAYCGLHMKPHGSRVFWWREQLEVPAWIPNMRKGA